MHKIFEYVHIISGVLFYLSSAVNPIIYNLLSSRFRERFQVLMCSHLSTNSSRNDSTPFYVFPKDPPTDLQEQERGRPTSFCHYHQQLGTGEWMLSSEKTCSVISYRHLWYPSLKTEIYNDVKHVNYNTVNNKQFLKTTCKWIYWFGLIWTKSEKSEKNKKKRCTILQKCHLSSHSWSILQFLWTLVKKLAAMHLFRDEMGHLCIKRSL